MENTHIFSFVALCGMKENQSETKSPDLPKTNDSRKGKHRGQGCFSNPHATGFCALYADLSRR